MKVEQIYELVNGATSEVIGESAVVNEDLSNLVDIGDAIQNAAGIDKYVNKLVDRIGKVVFVSRPYSGNAPSILVDSFEYGAIVQKISAEMPEAEENKSWELQDGTSYPYDTFYQPSVTAKFFNKKTTFEIDMSFTERQVKGSFTDANAMNAFLTMLYNAVDKSMTVKIDSLIMRTINNMIAETVADAYNVTAESESPVYTTVGNTRAINLLAMYNAKFGASLTPANALSTDAFIKFAALQMGLYRDRLSKISTLFNIGGSARFTANDYLHTIMLADFKRCADVYLNADTYHNDFVSLPNAEIVPYWQGSGTAYDFDSVSTINVKNSSGVTINLSGILAVMFDRDACGVSNLDRRVTTNYNPKAEFYTNFYKFDAGYYNDLNENFVVFFIA